MHKMIAVPTSHASCPFQAAEVDQLAVPLLTERDLQVRGGERVLGLALVRLAYGK